VRYYVGVVAARSGAAKDREAAIDQFQRAAQADPPDARAAVALGRILEARPGQRERAAALYRAALSLDPLSAQAEEGLVRVQTALNRPGDAIYHRARLCQLRDRPDEAARLYRRWGELQPERWESVLRAAECLLVSARRRDAAGEVKRGLERFPRNAELLGALAQLYLRTGDDREAAAICARWAPLDRTSGRPEWLRGQLAARALQNDEAIRWFEAAISKDPRNAIYHAALGEALSHAPVPERRRRARAELEEAISLDPAVALFHSQLGQVLRQSGDLEGARQSFLRALDRDSSDLEACRGVMSVARLLDRPGTAAFFSRIERSVREIRGEEQAARRVLSEHPREGRAHFALARALLRRGRLPEAKNQLALASEQPGGADARSLLRRLDRLLSVL
jgi:tetratricopeptide (TPR) repeat protein